MNAYAEGWVSSVVEEVLSGLILFGESALRKVFNEYGSIIFRNATIKEKGMGPWLPQAGEGHSKSNLIHTREKSGGLLKDYSRKAA